MIASLCQKGIVSTVHKHARINTRLHKHEQKIEQRLLLGFETISRLTTVLLGAQRKNILWYLNGEPLANLKYERADCCKTTQ